MTNDIDRKIALEVMRYADYRDGRAAKPVPIGDSIEGIIDIDFDWIEWTPSTDISQAMMVEDKILERGLQDKYCFELSKIVTPVDKEDIWNQRWYLIHATPQQRCQAALKAVE